MQKVDLEEQTEKAIICTKSHSGQVAASLVLFRVKYHRHTANVYAFPN